MSIDQRLMKIAASNNRPVTTVLYEYFHMCEMYQNLFFNKYQGRRSHIKALAYRTVEMMYGEKLFRKFTYL